MKKEFQKEYEDYMKDIVNKFSDLCSVKMDYQDYCNYISERDRDTRYSFWHPHERIFIDMMLDGSFEIKGVKEKILERQEGAKKWLSENLLTYDEWVVKYKNSKQKLYNMKSKLTKEDFQDLNTLTEEQNLELQKKFDDAMKEELLKPENQEFLMKWNEDGSKKNENS